MNNPTPSAPRADNTPPKSFGEALKDYGPAFNTRSYGPPRRASRRGRGSRRGYRGGGSRLHDMILS